MTVHEYLANPCGVSSLPYWKAKGISTPDGMLILHDSRFEKSILKEYRDEPYFRLLHTLEYVPNAPLPGEVSFCTPTADDLSRHINNCYEDLSLSPEELLAYTRHSVYAPDLWIGIKDNVADELVATGIAELDPAMGEGILEWIQVSEEYRGQGLGTCIVTELLRRMKGRATFVTVSGQVRNNANPEALYRKCGFTGNDIWHILTRK